MNRLTVLALAGALGFGASVVCAQTPLLRYTFDEASSGTTNALDTGTPPPANGVFNGGATRTTNTPSGSGAALDAVVDGYVSPGAPAKIDALGTATFTAWINLQGAPANGNRIFAKQNTASATFDGFSFAFSTPNAGTIGAGNFAINLAAGDASTFGFNKSSADIGADNKWTFVAATFNAGTVQFYSGDAATAVAALGNTVAGTNPTAFGTNTNEFRVAASSTSATSPPILIDDVRIYSQVLDASALDAVRASNVPEPASLALLAMGAGAVLMRRRRAGTN